MFNSRWKRCNLKMSELKQFSCDICDKKFKFSTTYKIHVNKHNGFVNNRQHSEKPVKSNQYPSTFKDVLHQQNKQAVHTITKKKIYPNQEKEEGKKDQRLDSKTSSHKSKQLFEKVETENDTEGDLKLDLNDSDTVKRSRSASKKITRVDKNREKRDKMTKIFACKVCLKLFSSKHSLTTHHNKHLGVQYACDQCGSSFTSKHSLKVHMLRHKDLKPWTCDLCGAQFSQNGHLKRHIKIHSGKRDQICEQCGKSFLDKDGLRAHKLTHSDITGHTCSVCGVKLKLKSSLRSHMKLHSVEKQFKCNICNRSFNQRKPYQDHMKLHTSMAVKRKAYLSPVHTFCSLCGKGFVNSTGLNKHMKKHELGLLKKYNTVRVPELIQTNKEVEVRIETPTFAVSNGYICKQRDDQDQQSLSGTVGQEQLAMKGIKTKKCNKLHENSFEQNHFSKSNVEINDCDEQNTRITRIRNNFGRLLSDGSDKTILLVNNNTEILLTNRLRPTNNMNYRQTLTRQPDDAQQFLVSNDKDNLLDKRRSCSLQGLRGHQRDSVSLCMAQGPSSSNISETTENAAFRNENKASNIDHSNKTRRSKNDQSTKISKVCRLTQNDYVIGNTKYHTVDVCDRGDVDDDVDDEDDDDDKQQQLQQEYQRKESPPKVGDMTDKPMKPQTTSTNSDCHYGYVECSQELIHQTTDISNSISSVQQTMGQTDISDSISSFTQTTGQRDISDSISTLTQTTGQTDDSDSISSFTQTMGQRDISDSISTLTQTTGQTDISGSISSPKQTIEQTDISESISSPKQTMGLTDISDSIISFTQTTKQTDSTNATLYRNSTTQVNLTFKCDKNGNSTSKFDLDKKLSLKDASHKNITLNHDKTNGESLKGKELVKEEQFSKLVDSGTKSSKTKSICEFCGRAFTQANHLYRHIRMKTCFKSFLCSVCNNAFRTSGQLTNHLKREHNLRYVCDLCDRSFVSNASLRKHQRFHVNGTSQLYVPRSFECRICGKKYKASSTLNYHLRQHEGHSFACDICGKVYGQKSHLSRHVAAIHHGIRQFKCAVDGCDKEFLDSRALRVHERTHTGVKPYQCNTCGRSFTESQNLKVHIKKHLNIKDFKCLICQQEFTTKMSMLRHSQRHASDGKNGSNSNKHILCKKHPIKKMKEKTLSCLEGCGGKFTTKRGMVAHMKRNCPLTHTIPT